ncbi:hypothetical protein [Chondromyces crocatus]|nr:hypothetical protein [Chondromyces crocatus]
MTDPSEEEILHARIRDAWSDFPTPHPDHLQQIAWAHPGLLEAFAGVAPIDVKTTSNAFQGCTPLLDLRPEAAAAYLGPFLLSFLQGAQDQRTLGIFVDLIPRAHLLTCLGLESFWRCTIGPHVAPRAASTLAAFIDYLCRGRRDFAITEANAETMRTLMAIHLRPDEARARR